MPTPSALASIEDWNGMLLARLYVGQAMSFNLRSARYGTEPFVCEELALEFNRLLPKGVRDRFARTGSKVKS